MIPTTQHENMDSGAMMRRASEHGEQMETYDPDRLIQEVAEMLRERGLHPELPTGTGRAGMAAGASGMLLRAFGILPAGDWQVRDRINAPDPDSR
jgi:hypothetical protein